MSDPADLDSQIIEKSMQDSSFRSELLASPKAALAKYFDMDLPENFSLNVVEDTDDSMTIVLPPATESLSMEELSSVSGGYIAGCKGCTRGSLGKRIIYTFGAKDSSQINRDI